jgi:2-C-methyl-D-erythritol 4-phosphate cytidylyltransferase
MIAGVHAILAAAGRGERLGGREPKAFAAIAGAPMVVHALRRLAAATLFERVVVAIPAGYDGHLRQLLVDGTPWPFEIASVVGGANRQESVRRALDDVPASAQIILVHDAARPFVTSTLLRACVDAAAAVGAAVAAVPIHDTLKRARDRRVEATLDRRDLWMAQTPQAFAAAILRAAHQRAARTGHVATDDAALVEWAGVGPRIVLGDVTNLKLTTPADLQLAERLLSSA